MDYLEEEILENWHDGWQDQCFFMCEIAGEICEWLNDLFKIAIERGAKLTEVQDCLMFMDESIVQMMNNNSRTKYRNCTDATTGEVTDSKRALRYEGPPEWVIPRFWRDLLLMAIIQKDAAVLEAFKAYWQQGQQMKKDAHWGEHVTLTDLLEFTHDPDKPERTKDNYSGQGFQDEWHTDAMRAALPELRALFV